MALFMLHLLTHFSFLNSNKGSMTNGRGGAIKTELGTFLTVSKCHFENNKAAGGGAIFHRGKMLAVTDSSFYNNIAKEGGAIMFDSTHGPVLARCIFVNNHAISSNGGAIELYKSEFTTYDTLSGSGNSPCNGIYDNSEKVCRKWDLPSTGNSVDIGQVTVSSLGLRLSKGLSAKIIAQAGKSVEYTSPERFRSSSQLKFHTNPDGAAVFPLNDGGWIYMSNAENEKAQGGVFGVEFDSHGRPRNYMSYLTGTTRNCSGGKTPWNTWVSCEEYDGGLCWQVDPTGERKSVKTKLVEGPGSYESMAFDISDPNDPSFFVTEDHERGAIRRFKPVCNNLDLSWNLLQVDGEIDYLQFTGRNTFQWTSSLDKGRNSAQAFYPNVEGISVNGRILSFVAKTQKEIFHLNLDNGTYTVESTERGLLLGGGSFSAEPDQIIQYGHVLYFTEDGGSTPGIYASDGIDYYTLFEADDKKFSGDETTGLAFSPDGTRLYVCIQAIGYLFEITRNDGLPFPGQQGVSHLRLRHTK